MWVSVIFLPLVPWLVSVRSAAIWEFQYLSPLLANLGLSSIDSYFSHGESKAILFSLAITSPSLSLPVRHFVLVLTGQWQAQVLYYLIFFIAMMKCLSRNKLREQWLPLVYWFWNEICLTEESMAGEVWGADHYIQSHEAEGREEFGAGYRIQGTFWSKYFWWSVTFLRFHHLPKMYYQLRGKIWNPQVDEAYFTLKPQQLWKDIDKHLQNRLFCGNTHWNPLQRWLLSGVWVEQKYLHFLYPLRAAYLFPKCVAHQLSNHAFFLVKTSLFMTFFYFDFSL